MQLPIGNRIKELRTRKQLTQEQLSTAIGVTPQAISRWESENGYPDIETLPRIAHYFGISVDELLGLKQDEREIRRKEIYQAIEKNKEMGLGKEVLSEARLYAAEFPGDEKIQEHLADTLCRGYMWDDTPDLDRLREAEKLYHTLADTTKDSEFRRSMLESLAYLYAVGFKDRFKLEQTIRQLPLMLYSRESVAAHAYYQLDGTLAYTQDYIEKLTGFLASTLEWYIIEAIDNSPSMWDTKIEMFEKLIELYTFIFGENMLFYHARLAGLHRIIATYTVAQGKYEVTLDHLETMLAHIKKRDAVREGDTYDSPFMTELAYPGILPGMGAFDDLTVHNDAWYILTGKLTQSRYDPIREMPRFKAIIAELEAFAK